MSNFPYRDRIARLPKLNALAGLYLLREGSGTAAVDYSRNRKTATLIGSPSWITGGGLTLNGSTQAATIPNNIVDIGSDFGLFARIFKTNTPGNNDDRIFDFTDDANNSFQLTHDNSSGKYLVLLKRGGTSTINQLSYGTFTTGAWVTIGYTMNGSTGTFFIEGAPRSTDGSGSVGIAGSTYNIGRRGDGTPTAFLSGSIAAWGIWQTALPTAAHADIHRLIA